jgi:hypothetical protein
LILVPFTPFRDNGCGTWIFYHARIVHDIALVGQISLTLGVIGGVHLI